MEKNLMKWSSVFLAMTLLGMAGQASAQDAEAGKKVFSRCKACHTVDAPTNKVGPHLDGIVGRKAASLPNFVYSDAMKAKGAEGLVWDEANLTSYLTDPKGFIPGNKMAFAGVKKPEDLANLIAYLKTATAK
jgi:cytochrome c